MARRPEPARGAVRRALALAAALLAAGCSTAPPSATPALEMPPAWRIDVAQANGLADTRWWGRFGDPALEALVDEALRANLDLRVAAARVEQFDGVLVATRAQALPQIGYGLDATRTRSSRVGQPPLPSGSDATGALYRGLLTAQWQIDLFGRVQRLSEAAQARVYASEQARRAVVQALVAAVATGYVTLRGLDRSLQIAQATEANFAKTRQIFDLRYRGGVVSGVTLAQVVSQHEQARAAIPAIQQQVAAQENALSQLLGRAPGPIPRGRTIDELIEPALPEGLPSSLLTRRPDILQAEQSLAAAGADAAAARLLYFPALSLTGLLGSVSAALGDFLSGPSATWTLAAGLAGPLFTFGAIEGQIQSAEAQQREAEALYRQTVLSALRETNDALSASTFKREEVGAQGRRVAALREFARLSKLKFDGGYASYLEVLVAENELFSAELLLVRSQAERFVIVVDVYRALGGGWIDEAEQLAPRPFAAAEPAR